MRNQTTVSPLTALVMLTCAGLGFYWAQILSLPIGTLPGSSVAMGWSGGLLAVSTLAHLVAMVLAYLAAFQLDALADRPPFVAFVAAAVSLGTALVVVSSDGTCHAAAFDVGGILIGVGSAGLIVSWSKLVGQLGIQAVKLAVGCSFPLALIFYLVRLPVAPALSNVLVACFSLASMCCYLRAVSIFRENPLIPESRNEGANERKVPVWLLAYAGISEVPFGIFQGRQGLSEAGGYDMASAVLCTLVFVAVLIAYDNRGLLNDPSEGEDCGGEASRRGSFAFRAVLPLCAAGVILYAFVMPDSASIPGVFMFAGNTLLMTFIYLEVFMLSCDASAGPIRAVAMGDISQSAGLVLGAALGVTAGRGFAALIGCAAVLASLLLVVVQGRRAATGGRKDDDSLSSAGGADDDLWASGLGFSRLEDALGQDSEADIVDIVRRRCDAIADEGGLSGRETEILFLLARGKSIPDASAELFLSQNTVKTYVSRIYSKLGIHSRRELADLIKGAPKSGTA